MPFINNDSYLLEKTYISMSKNIPTLPSDEHEEDKSPSSHSADDFEQTEDSSNEDEEDRTIEIQAPISSEIPASEISSSSIELPEEENCEEHDMIIDNLNSIRESVTKIANFCVTGSTLEVWQSQKLAIAMDNLAEVARRLR